MITFYDLDVCCDTHSRRFTKAKKVRTFPFLSKETLLEVLKYFMTEEPLFKYRVEVIELEDDQVEDELLELPQKNTQNISECISLNIPLNQDIVKNLGCIV
jgi:hypothetical protein